MHVKLKYILNVNLIFYMFLIIITPPRSAIEKNKMKIKGYMETGLEETD